MCTDQQNNLSVCLRMTLNRGIRDAWVDEAGHLQLRLTDGEQVDAGQVREAGGASREVQAMLDALEVRLAASETRIGEAASKAETAVTNAASALSEARSASSAAASARTAASAALPKAGGDMTGNLRFTAGKRIRWGSGDAGMWSDGQALSLSADAEAANITLEAYDGEEGSRISLFADVVDAWGARLTNLGDPEEDCDAATKAYVDQLILDLTDSLLRKLDTMTRGAAQLGSSEPGAEA